MFKIVPSFLAAGRPRFSIAIIRPKLHKYCHQMIHLNRYRLHSVELTVEPQSFSVVDVYACAG